MEVEREREVGGLETTSMEEKVAPWTKQLTARGLVASIAIGVIYSAIVMKLNLTTGLVPNLNVSASLVAFLVIRIWIKLLEKVGVGSAPFTRQENTIIQTCATACYCISTAAGFGSFLLGLNYKTYVLSGVDTEGNSIKSTKEPAFGWITTFLFVSSFVGITVLVPLRKIMIVDYKLTYPSGTATAVLINGFHTSKGDKMGKKQVRGFTKFFSFSFAWALFQWFYAGGELCGFAQFPTLGLKAWRNSFYFDFSMTYVGAGMICTHLVNLSLLFGAVLSYGIMWPLIKGLKGEWFPANLSEGSMKSLNGYKVFICISLILGDGLYNFAKIVFISARNFQARANNKQTIAPNDDATSGDTNKDLDEQKLNEVFLKDGIPIWMSCVGYVVFSIVSIAVIPIMFPQLKWYFIVVAYLLAPLLSFCNAYGSGLTDQNMAYNYGKVALFIIAALSGKENGVVAGS